MGLRGVLVYLTVKDRIIPCKSHFSKCFSLISYISIKNPLPQCISPVRIKSIFCHTITLHYRSCHYQWPFKQIMFWMFFEQTLKFFVMMYNLSHYFFFSWFITMYKILAITGYLIIKTFSIYPHPFQRIPAAVAFFHHKLQ